MLFKINLASLIVGRKFTVFALFYFVSEGGFQVQTPRGSLYLEGRFNGGFLCTLRVWGAYIWRPLIHRGAYFRNFTVYQFSWSESQNGRIFNPKFANINSPRVRK